MGSELKGLKMVPELRFREFSGEWESKKLVEISVDGFSNGAFNDPNKVGSGYRIINVKDMYIDTTINVNNLERVAIDKDEFEKNKVLYGDIFFTRSSLVKSGIAVSNINLTKEDDLTYDGHLIKMTPNKERYSSLFLYNHFKTRNSRKQFIVRGKTATMTTIGQSDIADIHVASPSLAEQEKIAGFLGAVDNKIEGLKKKKDLLGDYKKGMMQKLFPKDGCEPVFRFKDVDGGTFGDWVVKRLGEVAGKPMYGLNAVAKPYDGKHKYIRITDIDEESNSFSPNKITSPESYSDEFILAKNDIVFARTGASVGKSYLYKPSDGVLYFAGFLIKFSILKEYNSKFVFYTTIRDDYRNWVEVNSVRSGQPGINAEEYKLFEIPMPSLAEQNKIAEFLSGIDSKIGGVEKQIESVEEFKKGLLQKLFV